MSSPMSASDFALEVFQNEYLPAGGREVNAIVTVTAPITGKAAGPGAPADGADRAEIIIVDCSGSMDNPRSKIVQARAATTAAIDALMDGVAFAVIAGTETAKPAFPADGSLILATTATRQEARRAVTQLRAGGGTAMGTWLSLAAQIFGASQASLRHAILLTDGRNESESAEQLGQALAACEGVFSCDCRGVGTDWVVAELRKISTALLGSVDIVADPAGLATDFETMMQAAMGKQVGNVMLRVWTPQHAQIKFVRQVAPAVDDMTSRRIQSAAQAGDFPTGAWADGESRDYHLCVQVTAAGVGQEMLAARVSLVSGTEVLGQGLVRAVWTDDEALSTRINRNVAHYTGQAELAQVIQDGLEARKRGDDDLATAKLDRAVKLAVESGNDGTARLLAKVVDVVDIAAGTVRLKRAVAEADEMALDTRSTKTVRSKK